LRQLHKLVFCLAILASTILISTCLTIPSLNRRSNEGWDLNAELGTNAIITLDELLTYSGNYTYSVTPLFSDRYFGSNVFELNITQINGSATEIKIEIGQYLNITLNSDLSNFTIAKEEWLNTTGLGFSGVLNLTVFDINVAGEVPQPTDAYKIVATKATGDLLTLLNYIDNYSLYNAHHAQLAVWAVSDGPNMIPSGFIYNNTEVDWANAILAGAGIILTIPYIPTIPGFNPIFLLLGLGLVLFPAFLLKMRRREFHG